MERNIKILIIGNGFGGVYTLRNLHKIFHGSNKKMKFSLIGEKNYFLFTPLLHEVATGSINPHNIIEPIRKILGCCLDELYLGKAESINFAENKVKVNGISISYDYLIISPGAETNFFDTPGAEKYSFTLKSIDDANKIKNHIIAQMERASLVENREERKKMLRFVVVGGGPTGVELAVELKELIKKSFSHYYSKEIIEDASTVLIQKAGELVPQFGIKMREKSLRVLQKKGINVMLNSTVDEIGNSYISIKEKGEIFTETVVWTAGIKPVKLKFEQEIPQSPDGRIIVNEYLQLEKYKNVFAIGDIALFKQKNLNYPLPALAQVAQKESATVAKNIKHLINNEKLEEFSYKSSGSLLSLGQWMAVGEISNFTFSGHLAWWLWRTIYLSKLITVRKKIEVALDWTINLFSPRDISQI